MSRRWAALLAYVVASWVMLPYAPRLGAAVRATTAGRWLLGPGLMLAAVVGGVLVAIVLRRRRAEPRAWAGLAVVVAGYGAALWWLRGQHLERVHLVEYGVMTWLAWRALAPAPPRPVWALATATLLAAGLGWGEELLQAVTPGRVYDLRDVVANALGAVLGALVLAVCARAAVSGEASS